MSEVARAYASGAHAWSDGPARVYGRLAVALVESSPIPLTGRRVLDLGSGTGVGSRAAEAAGARVVATDFAAEMLLVDRATRPPGCAGDARRLPFRRDAFDVVLAPFSLNHLDDPTEGVAEAGRVGRLLLASTYANDDDHPAKQAVESALEEHGWHRPDWYVAVKRAMAAWGTVDAATEVVQRGGLHPVAVQHRRIVLADLGPRDMVEWRLGMAPAAPFLATLPPAERERVVRRALEVLGADPPALERRVILIAAERRP